MKLLKEGAVNIEEKLTSSPRKVDASFIFVALSVLVVLHSEGTLFLGVPSKKRQNDSASKRQAVWGVCFEYLVLTGAHFKHLS